MPFRRRLYAALCILGLVTSTTQAHCKNKSKLPVVASHSTAKKHIPCQDAVPEARPIALGAYYFDNGRCAPGDVTAISSFKLQTGRTPAVWMIFQSWSGWNEFPIAQARLANEQHSTLMVTWEPWGGRRNDHSWTCQNVVSGHYDGYIRSYARAVKFAEVPVMIRFAHEMNGDWYPWSTAYNGYGKRNNDNSPAMFAAMWKHVVSIFRKEGATNAKWVWSPNIIYTNNFNDQAQQERDLFALYPGDEWVDWVGVSVYNDGSKRAWHSFSSLFDSTYAALTQLSPRPLMIAELGVTEEGAPEGQTKAAWLEQTLGSDIPEHYKRVRLVTYFCRDKTATGEANYRFDSSPASLAAFREVANSPLYSGVLR